MRYGSKNPFVSLLRPMNRKVKTKTLNKKKQIPDIPQKRFNFVVKSRPDKKNVDNTTPKIPIIWVAALTWTDPQQNFTSEEA